MSLSRCLWVVCTATLLLSGPITSEQATTPPDDSVTSPSLVGVVWNLVDLRGTLEGDVPATIEFLADGRMGGHDGCNYYRGSYSVDGANLEISQEMLMTRMACPEPLAGRVLSFSVALGKVSTFEIEGSDLVLRADGGSRLVTFRAEAGNLQGSSWQVRAYNNGQQGVVTVLVGMNLTARFEEDGTVAGHAGCNSYRASYEVQGEQISIGPALATRKHCGEPAGAMQQEDRFLTALQTASSFRISGEKLELRTAEGALAATFVRLEASD